MIYKPNEIEKLYFSTANEEKPLAGLIIIFSVDAGVDVDVAAALFSSYLILLNLSLSFLMKNLVQLKLRHCRKKT